MYDFFYGLVMNQIKKNVAVERAIITKTYSGNLYDFRIGNVTYYKKPIEVRPGDNTTTNLYKVNDIVRVSKTQSGNRIITGYDNFGTSKFSMMEI